MRTRTIPDWSGRSGGTYQHAATGTAQSFGSSCRTAAAPRRDYHRRNRRRGCETHGGMRPGSWSEPSAYGTVSCIVPAGAVACGREHGQKKRTERNKKRRRNRHTRLFRFFVCAPWARSNGCKSRTRPDSGKCIAEQQGCPP